MTEAPVLEVKLSPATENMLAKLAKESAEESARRNVKPVPIGGWPKDIIPDKVESGHAVISDADGNGIQTIELYLLMQGGNATRCFPISGRQRGVCQVGSLVPNISNGETVVLQFTPYPQLRDDGRPHIEGPALYPNHGPNATKYVEYKGTFYNKNHAVSHEMLRKVQGAA